MVLLSVVVLQPLGVGFAVLWHGCSGYPFDHPFGLPALLVACIAIELGFVWRSSRSVQYHVCFWAGLGVLAATLLLTTHIMAANRAGEVRDDFLGAPCFIAIATAIGLILLLTALCLDRPAPRAWE